MSHTLKDKVHEHLVGVVSDDILAAHKEQTTADLVSQKEFLKRVVVERSDNPLMEVDSIKVITDLPEQGLCPFILNHLGE